MNRYIYYVSTKQMFTCSNSAVERLEKGVKYVQILRCLMFIDVLVRRYWRYDFFIVKWTYITPFSSVSVAKILTYKFLLSASYLRNIFHKITAFSNLVSYLKPWRNFSHRFKIQSQKLTWIVNQLRLID